MFVGGCSTKWMGGTSIPLKAKWSSGVYMDFRGYADGTTLSASFAPQISLDDNLITPVGGGVIDGTGIGGNSAVRQLFASSPRFVLDWLVPLVAGAGKSGSVVFRVARGYPVGTGGLFGFGNSAQSTNDFLRGTLPGGAALSPVFAKDAVGEATKTLTSSGAIDWVDHVLAFVTDGSTGTIYVDGAAVAAGDLDTIALTVNRCVFGARVSTAVLDFFDGWIQCFAMTTEVLTQPEIEYIDYTWRAGDQAHPGTGNPIMAFGDSIMQADSDTYSVTPTTGSPQYADGAQVGGLRSRLFTFLRLNRIPLKWVGPFTQGFFPNPEHGAHGGANLLQIRDNYVTPYLPVYKPYLSVVMAGTNNMVAVEGGAQTLASAWDQYTSLLDTMFALQQAGYAPGGRIVVTDITPIQTGAGGATAVSPYNAGLPAIWDAFDAVHPNNKLFRFSFFNAIGGVWNAAYYRDGTDTTHPNYLGYNLGIGDYVTPGPVGVAMLDAYDGTMKLRDYAPILATA